MKRDAWTSSFPDILFALDFPKLVDKPPVVPDPDRLPGAFVHIPDSNLRTAIAEALGKSPNAPITVEEMGKLGRLDARDRGIQDLTGLQFATNLGELRLRGNQINDISPIGGLIDLRRLYLHGNPVSDISPLRGLKNLVRLGFEHTLVTDISPLRGLKNLIHLHFHNALVSDLSPVSGLTSLTLLGLDDTLVSDLSPVEGLINLEELSFSNNDISDLSPFAGLINLERIFCWGHAISDLSPLVGLTKLEKIDFCGGNISNLSPLSNLTSLKELYFRDEKISDISPLTGLTELTRLGLGENDISDVSPLASLANLTWLDLSNNRISNFSSLDGLRENIKLLWHGNPAFPKGGPKIEGPWLWVILPDTKLDSRIDLLSEVSDGTVTEVEIAARGVVEGKSVGDEVWTTHKLPPTGRNNIGDMLKRSRFDGVVYGFVSLYSPREQDTTMYVGSQDGVKVWLNGTLVYERISFWLGDDYQDFFPVTLKRGRNALLVAVRAFGSDSSGFFGFEPGTEYTVANPSVGYTFSQTSIHTGDTFILNIRAENITDLAGWQFDIAFDPAALEAINVTEGEFLKTDGGTTFFHGGSIDNAAGKITGLSAARLSAQGVTGTGVLLQVRFKAKSGGETKLALQNFELGAINGENIPAGPHEIRIVVEGGLTTGDVNRDGRVSILDLILVAQQLGKKVATGSPVDVNGDGVVSILDLIRIAQGIGNTTVPAAPSTPTMSLTPLACGGERGGKSCDNRGVDSTGTVGR